MSVASKGAGARSVAWLLARLFLGLCLATACDRSPKPTKPEATAKPELPAKPKPSAAGRVPTLDELPGGDAVKDSGRRLMASPTGLHRLDTTSKPHPELIVGVHGFESKGYEWIEPLHKLNKGDARIYFYRWDFRQCPEPPAKKFETALEGLLKDDPTIKEVTIFAHSYAGVMTTTAALNYDIAIPVDLHIIASPLAGMDPFTGKCDYPGAKAPPDTAKVTLHQWRTRKELDGVYRDEPNDPQVVDLPGEVTRLPETYNGHKLGHNWSISWVVDHLAGAGASP